MYTSDIRLILCECEWFHSENSFVNMIGLEATSKYLMNTVESAFIYVKN